MPDGRKEMMHYALSALYPGINTLPDTLQERLLQEEFSNEQVQQAKLGLENGLSKRDVLLYFEPGYSPKRMEAMRTVLAR